MKINFIVNNEKVCLDVEPNKTLLEVLRDELNLVGAKESCSTGECGACTVIMNNKAVPSCLILAPDAQGKKIITIEGLTKEGKLDPIQEAFIKHGALQCGFCTPGLILASKALFMRNKTPSDDEIFDAIEGHLCRCTGYSKILKAIKSIRDSFYEIYRKEHSKI